MSYEVALVVAYTAIGAYGVLRLFLVVRGLLGRWPGRRFALIATQVSLLVFLVEVLSTGVGSAILAAFVPPIMLILLPRYLGFAAFLSQTLIWVVPVGVAVLAVCAVSRPLRSFVVVIVGLVMMATSFVVGDVVSVAAMCRTALERGVSEIQRNSLLWSFANAPTEFQFEIHAVFMHRGQEFGWSYRQMDWYPVPPGTWATVNAPSITCR